MATNFSIQTIFKAVDKVSGPLTRMTSKVTRFADRAESSLGRVNRRLGSMQNAVTSGVRTTAAAATTGAAALAKVTQVGADFEQQITNAAAKFPGAIRRGSAAFDQLSDKARQVGETTEFSASQAAQALDFLAMAGFDADQAIGALPLVVDLATSSNLDLATATDIASDALGQFNLTSKDAATQSLNLARITDVMSKTATSANTTVSALFETYKDAGPVATAAGASIETLSALTGELANAGIKGGRAGTALRAVFGRLQAPTGEAAKIIKRLGVQTRDTSGNMLDVIDILGNLTSSLDGLGTSQRAEVLKKIFGEEPIAAVNILLSAGTDRLKGFREQLERTEGSTASLAKVMRDTTGADIKGMMSAIEGVTITLFDLNRKGIREGIGGVTNWVRSVNEMLKTNEDLGRSIGIDLVTAVVSLVKVIGILIAASIALKTATVATSIAIGAFRVVSMAATVATVAWTTATAAAPAILATVRAAVLALNIALAMNPIGLVITAIGGLVAAATLLIANWDKVTDFFKGMWATVKDLFASSVQGITAVVSPFFSLIESLGNIWDKLRGATSDPINAEINTRQNVSTTAGAGVISPQEAITRSINENKSSAEVTLRNETNTTAEVSKRSGPMSLNIANSGAF